MRFTFRGVRGSIPTPGPDTVKYGGNTTCIEIRTQEDELIILDAGTGIHALAQTLDLQQQITAHIFITHTHWDHIQGLPFFSPIFIAENQITIYGGLDPVTQQGIQRAMTEQLQYSFFPIREVELKARLDYRTIQPGKPVHAGSAIITPTLLNHPVLNFGYRIDCDGHSIFFSGDYEPVSNIYDENDPNFEEYQILVDQKQIETERQMSGLDALIIDSSYTTEEYLDRKGWGHGSYNSALQIAERTGCKRVFLTHHEPARTDRQLDRIHQQLLKDNSGAAFEIVIAREGVEVRL